MFAEFQASQQKYGDLSILPTRFFLSPLRVDEELQVSIEPGKNLFIQLLAVGQGNALAGTRDVYFQLNGESRVVTVPEAKTSFYAF